MEYIQSEFAYQPVTGELNDTQLAQRGNWSGIPHRNLAHASAHIVHVVPKNGSSVTTVNPVDPATTSENVPSWIDRPSAPTHLHAARRPFDVWQ